MRDRIEREASGLLRTLAERYPVVTLTGPRQQEGIRVTNLPGLNPTLSELFPV